MQGSGTFPPPSTPLATPVAQPVRKTGKFSAILLTLLTLLLALGGLYWLHWASVQGLQKGYPKPSVRIQSASSVVQIDKAVHFSAAANGRDLTYSWKIDDGSKSGYNGGGYGGGPGSTYPTPQATGDHKFSDKDVTYTYHHPGEQTVTVTVTDPLGQTSSDSMTLSVVPPAPVASFTYTIYHYFGSYYQVRFDASNSYADATTSIKSYNWDFGDNSYDSTDTAYYSSDSHYYNQTGTFTVTLTVTDDYNQQSQPYTATITITDTNNS